MMFINKKKNRFPGAYISEIDKCLTEFDRTHAWSKRQKVEIEKYQHIFKQRDHPLQPESKKSIWDFEEQEHPCKDNRTDKHSDYII